MNGLFHRIFDSKKVIIFDIDGTLVYIMDVHTRAYIDCIWELCRVKIKTFEDVSKHYGIQNQETFRRILTDYSVPFTEELITKLVNLRGDKMASPTADISEKNILGGVISLLDHLQSDGKQIATITGNSRQVGEAVLMKTTLSRFFEIQVYGDDLVKGEKIHGR
ncbi:MAG: HAD hydrolase-like protein, partial [archaeon]